jgi:hypothetical protein
MRKFRKDLSDRNKEICADIASGSSLSVTAKKFSITCERVRQIVFRSYRIMHFELEMPYVDGKQRLAGFREEINKNAVLQAYLGM